MKVTLRNGEVWQVCPRRRPPESARQRKLARWEREQAQVRGDRGDNVLGFLPLPPPAGGRDA